MSRSVAEILIKHQICQNILYIYIYIERERYKYKQAIKRKK